MAELESLIPTARVLAKQFLISAVPLIFHRPCVLARETASMRIGRWRRQRTRHYGWVFQENLNSFAVYSVYKLILVELRIYQVYFAPPEHITERVEWTDRLEWVLSRDRTHLTI